jgi:hypothetical protein
MTRTISLSPLLRYDRSWIEAFKHRQREFFENVAVRHAAIGYLERKGDRRESPESELLAMLIEMDQPPSDEQAIETVPGNATRLC